MSVHLHACNLAHRRRPTHCAGKVCHATGGCARGRPSADRYRRPPGAQAAKPPHSDDPTLRLRLPDLPSLPIAAPPTNLAAQAALACGRLNYPLSDYPLDHMLSGPDRADFLRGLRHDRQSAAATAALLPGSGAAGLLLLLLLLLLLPLCC